MCSTDMSRSMGDCVYQLPDPGAGDDVGAAERLRKQFLLAHPEQDYRQHRVRLAAADQLSRVLCGLCARFGVSRVVRWGWSGGRRAAVLRATPAAPLWVISFALLGGGLLGSLGVVAGIWADKFDQPRRLPEFPDHAADDALRCVLLDSYLPEFWQRVSHFNPFFYMIDGFRYGFFGQSDVSPWLSMAVVVVFCRCRGSYPEYAVAWLQAAWLRSIRCSKQMKSSA